MGRAGGTPRRPRAGFAAGWSAPQCRAGAPRAAGTSLDEEIRGAVAGVCGQHAVSVSETTAAAGQTNLHFRVELADGGAVLVKAARARTAPSLARARFHGELAGLRALRGAARGLPLRVPPPLGLGGARTPLAVLGWAELAPFGLWVPGAQARLGAALAQMHSASQEQAARARVPLPGFGFEDPTFLGEAPLDNRWGPDWVPWFLRRRLLPRLQEALRRGAAFYGTSNEDSGALAACAERVGDVGRVRWALFDGVEVRPALLHGDVFSGNCGVEKGSPECLLFDPAAYWGHAEVDLAVSTLFGRFGDEFYYAYHAVRPKEQGFEQRRVLYRFYYLLNLLVRHGAGFGPGGSTEDPRGYFELCCDHARKLMELLE